MSKAYKGGDFEREFAKELSLWWTSGARDDIFWRTSGSGARATTRGATGRRTEGSYGDITATSSLGEPFTDLLTLELKRGYSYSTISDLLERSPASKTIQEWEKFILQAWKSHQQAGSFSWGVVARRDRRASWIYFSRALEKAIRESIGTPLRQSTFVEFQFTAMQEERQFTCFGCPVSNFFTHVTPDLVRELSRRL